MWCTEPWRVRHRGEAMELRARIHAGPGDRGTALPMNSQDAGPFPVQQAGSCLASQHSGGPHGSGLGPRRQEGTETWVFQTHGPVDCSALEPTFQSVPGSLPATSGRVPTSGPSLKLQTSAPPVPTGPKLWGVTSWEHPKGRGARTATLCPPSGAALGHGLPPDSQSP